MKKSQNHLLARSSRSVIVVVEDDNDDFYFISKALSEVFVASEQKRFKNGSELLDYLHCPDEHIEFILLDLNLPVLNGRETLKVIKQELFLELPIYVLSVSNHLHERELCFENGAQNYFVKPCRYATYVEQMRAIQEEQKTLATLVVFEKRIN